MRFEGREPAVDGIRFPLIQLQRIRGDLSFEAFIERVVGVLETQHALARPVR